MTNEATTRAAALAMLASGEATQSEVAELAGVSRQLVRYWAKAADVDAGRARAARLASAWRKRLKLRRR